MLVNLCLHHKFILDRRCQFSRQILVICGTFWFSAFIWGKPKILKWRLMPNARRTGRIIGSDSVSHLETPQSHGNDSEPGKLDSVRIEAEMLNGVSMLVSSCFKNRIGRGFYIALWPATKNGSATIIPSAENHRECPDMPPRRRPDRIFTVPRLCSEFSGTSSVWCIMSCWNRVKPSETITEDRYRTQLMC